MAPPTTTTARLTRGEAGRCARPLSLEPLKLEDGDHTGVEESPAEQRHPSLSTTTFARPPAERRHPSLSTTTSARPPAERRHPSSSTTTSPRPPAERRHPSPSTTLSARPPAGRRHHRGWHCTSKPSASSPVSTDDDHTAVETPKCSSATRPALHVQARHRPDAAITAKTPKCNPTTRPALHVLSPAPTRRCRTPPGRPPRRAAWSRRADLQLGTRARARTHVRACIAR